MTPPLVSHVVGEVAALAGLETGDLLKTYRRYDERTAARRAMWALSILRPDLACPILAVWFDSSPEAVRDNIRKARAIRRVDPFERREQDMVVAAFTTGGDHAQAA